MNRAENKASRLLQIEELLLGHPEGMSQSEIARRLQVNRSTINRYLPDLPKHIYIDSDNLWRIDRQAYLVKVRFNLNEAMAVHLASRLLATRMERHNPHAAAALRKLGLALERLAPTVSRHLKLSADVMDDPGQRQDPVFLQALERLTLAWADQRKVQVWHRREASGQVYEYTFSPYFIEPYAVGQSTHIIGWREPPGAMRTFKIERIERVELLRETYAIPPDFDPRHLLEDAWGIWYTESEPVEVVLRFSPRVASRVRETRWHRSESVSELPDGWLQWTAQVAEPQEMLPWIRGWGSDCEVVGPRDLREALVKEVKKTARVYNVEAQENFPAHFHLWAKADRAHPEKIHRLVYHLIDVGMVAKTLWRLALPSQLKTQISTWLNLSVDDTGNLLAFWASLHDLGKASPAFQFKLKHMISTLREQGFEIRDSYDKPVRHEVITANALDYEFENLLEEIDLDKILVRRIAQALGGHHGAWHLFDEIKTAPPSECGNKEWTEARRTLIRELKMMFSPPACNPSQLKPVELNALFTIVSGFVSIVDWLGSDESLFRYNDEFMPLDDYARDAKRQAHDGLQKKGWTMAFSLPVEFDFARLFDVEKPRRIQEEVIGLAGSVSLPALVIIESPTGSGKTEAALSLYALWTQSVERPGLYVAMPTTATSDQMHERVAKFLSTRHQMNVKPLLVHSRALLREEETQMDDADKVEEDLTQRQTWFLPRKRSLLAPFGVGTVDQTFLSVLQTKHFFVRLLGLCHKVVIFDEIHAYDAYMAEIFCRLLRWLREIGASVILLSATLPEASRRRFVEAYTDCENDESPSVEYPRLTLATSQGVQIHLLPKPEEQPKLALERMGRGIDEITGRVLVELQQDGCLAVICNTVSRAQDVYSALEAANKTEPFCPDENLILFHARTTQRWRDETQTKVLNAVSKQAREKGERPHRMVVVATQVIEQSLDLDFDVMFTDLAPLDLLVQRAGRLHRHPPRERAHLYRLLITAPEMKGAIPQFPKTEFPYEPNFLFRTWAVLRDYDSLTLTADAPRLIEKVYGEEDLPDLSPVLGEVMQKAKQDCERDRAAAEREAGRTLVSKPSIPTLMAQSNQELLEDDDPQTGQAMRALTRRDAPGVSLVCLHRVSGQVCLGAEGTESVDVNHPTRAQVLKLARQIVTVSSYPLVEYFKTENETNYPQRWKKIAALRHARLAVFENGEFTESTKFTLRLTRALGLQIDYRKSGGQDDEL